MITFSNSLFAASLMATANAANVFPYLRDFVLMTTPGGLIGNTLGW